MKLEQWVDCNKFNYHNRKKKKNLPSEDTSTYRYDLKLGELQFYRGTSGGKLELLLNRVIDFCEIKLVNLHHVKIKNKRYLVISKPVIELNAYVLRKEKMNKYQESTASSDWNLVRVLT